ncbi:ORF074L [Rock bream iridovirus]|uniref:ORF074L n=2 Tax=Infectious spleen and kidney necrosis virus TaxID=180170 RepID=Q5YF13_ISKNV|nr:ORF074L [Rock bream iridovirus]AMM72708.1 ORF084L [giant sea perch iridovirus - K1]
MPRQRSDGHVPQGHHVSVCQPYAAHVHVRWDLACQQRHSLSWGEICDKVHYKVLVDLGHSGYQYVQGRPSVYRCNHV